jgi:hypothetical protein
MIDSNVLVSAVYNPNSKPARAVRDACENHFLNLDLERPKVLTPAQYLEMTETEA